MRKTLACLLAALALGLGPAGAQDYPTRPVKIFIAFPVGGLLDTVSRIVGEKLSGLLGQQFVIEARPGAGGTIATLAVAKADPDGYTLMMINDNHALNPSVFKNIPYDSVKDFAPIGFVGYTPLILVANPSVPAKDVKELIVLAKARPGQLNFAIGAVGSSLHMAGEAFKMQSGVDIVNIPYKGTAPAVQDLLAGQVQLMFAAVGNVKAHIQAGKLKALGVTTATRLPVFPEVPAIAEALPGYESSAWFGLFGPARLPADVSRKLSDAARRALQQPDMLRRLDTEGAIPVGNSPEQFAAFVQSEIPRWAKVVKFSGAKPE